MLSIESRRLNGALREFLEAADCEVSIVIGGGRGQAGRHYLDKRNEAVKWTAAITKPLKTFSMRGCAEDFALVNAPLPLAFLPVVL
jgi:hypothetical protein